MASVEHYTYTPVSVTVHKIYDIKLGYQYKIYQNHFGMGNMNLKVLLLSKFLASQIQLLYDRYVCGHKQEHNVVGNFSIQLCMWT